MRPAAARRAKVGRQRYILYARRPAHARQDAGVIDRTQHNDAERAVRRSQYREFWRCARPLGPLSTTGETRRSQGKRITRARGRPYPLHLIISPTPHYHVTSQVVGIADPDMGRAQDTLKLKLQGPHALMYKDCQVFSTYQDALRNSTIHLAFIGMPHVRTVSIGVVNHPRFHLFSQGDQQRFLGQGEYYIRRDFVHSSQHLHHC